MNEIIPAEAIEAALKETGGPVMAIMNERAMVRRILEAAAPYMQAAWEESQKRPSVDAVRYYQERLDAAYRAGQRKR